MPIPFEIPFEKVIEALLDANMSVHAHIIHRLSDLDPAEANLLSSIWKDILLQRRQALMEEIVALSGDGFLLDFSALGRIVLKDEEPVVRRFGVLLLAEYEDNDLIPLFMDLVINDENVDVRTAAVSALGRFVYAGEIEALSAAKVKSVENLLLKVLNSEEAVSVRCAALESLGYSSRDEVVPLIQRAFESDDRQWQVSALLAMGRSANSIWQPSVMTMLESLFPSVRAEAARAAGELELKVALPYLMEMVNDADENARRACIWSLSQIGGDAAQQKIEELLEEADDDPEVEFLESALENLTFTNGVRLMPLFDFPDDEEGLDDASDWLDEMDEVDEMEVMEDLFDDEEGFDD